VSVNGNFIEVQTGECLCGVYWVGFGMKKGVFSVCFQPCFILCNLGGKTNKK
jgi:hypothetical protein